MIRCMIGAAVESCSISNKGVDVGFQDTELFQIIMKKKQYKWVHSNYYKCFTFCMIRIILILFYYFK